MMGQQQLQVPSTGGVDAASGGGGRDGGVQPPPAGGLLPLAPSTELIQRILLFWMNLPLFGKLAHTHHFTVFYCEIGVVGK